MKYIKLILIIPIIFFTNACYNYRELNELGITTAIGISKENELYKLTIEVLKIDGSEEKAIPEVKIFESSGRTIQEALRHTILDSSKRLYANHLFLLVIDSKLASEGIKDIIDLFFREPESRKQFYVAITDENMNELFNTTTPLDTINANSISKRIESNIEFLAKKLAREVQKTKMDVKMDSMNSYERRLVHEILKDFKGIKTESEGEEPNRSVVIKSID